MAKVVRLNGYEITDKEARGDIFGLKARVYTLENAPVPQDGSDGKSAYQSYLDTTSDSPALSEADWVASLHGADGTNGTNGTNGQDGADGKSISVKSATKSNGVTTVVLTDGTTDTTLTINDGTDGQDGQDGTNGTNGTDGQDGQDGITPDIKPNAGNTVSLVNGVYTLAQNATEHVYRLDFSYGSGDQRNFTTPNLLYGTDAILEAVDAIMNEQPASVAVSNE